jgi:hypothetical protein
MKKCFKCSIEKSKDEFYRHPAMADGYLGKCKECAKRDVRENRKQNIHHYRAFDRERGKLPHRVEAVREYQRTEAGRESHAKANSKWIEENDKARRAQNRLNNQKRFDPRLDNMPCLVCGRLDTHAHHVNYDQPLNVVWVCPKHHKEIHAAGEAI